MSSAPIKPPPTAGWKIAMAVLALIVLVVCVVIGVTLLSDGGEPAPGPASPVPSGTASAASTVEPAATSESDPRFASCAEAVAEGYGPYERGEDPEYGWYRDGDGDGVVCES